VVLSDVKAFTQGHRTCEALSSHVNGHPAAVSKQTSTMLEGLDEHQEMLQCVLYRWHDQVSDWVLQHCGDPNVQGHGGPLPRCTANAGRRDCQPEAMGTECCTGSKGLLKLRVDIDTTQLYRQKALVLQGNDGLPERRLLGPQSACLCMGSVYSPQHQAKDRGNDYGLR